MNASTRSLSHDHPGFRHTREHIRGILLSQVNPILIRLQHAIDQGNDLGVVQGIAEALHATVSNVVRPLSHNVAGFEQSGVDSTGDSDSPAVAQDWSSHRAQQELWITRNRLAHELHGGVQAELTAAALKLDAWSSHPCADTLSAVRVQISEALEQAVALLDEEWQPIFIDFPDALSAISAVWRGLVRVDFVIDEDACAVLSHDPIAAEAIVELVREGLRNAVRHGRASQVTIIIACSDHREIILVVEDNGSGPASIITPGLGSRIFDEVCLCWTLTASAAGARLEAHVPAQLLVTT